MGKLIINTTEQSIALTGDQKGNTLHILNSGPNVVLFAVNTDTNYIKVPIRQSSPFVYDFVFNIIDNIKFKTEEGESTIEYNVINKDDNYKIDLVANTPRTIQFNELYNKINIENINGAIINFALNLDTVGANPIKIGSAEKVRNMEFDGYFAKITFMSSTNCVIVMGVE